MTKQKRDRRPPLQLLLGLAGGKGALWKRNKSLMRAKVVGTRTTLEITYKCLHTACTRPLHNEDSTSQHRPHELVRGIRCAALKTPSIPQKLESFIRHFCSFRLSRDRHCHGTRKRPHRLSSDKLLRVAVPSQLRVNLHAWRIRRRFKNALTHVENLSQSDKTDVANALLNMDTKLGACQSSHALSSLACVRGFAGVPCLRIFRARGGDEFLRMCS